MPEKITLLFINERKTMNKLSFITTVYNEERHIQRLLDSLEMQTLLPDEVVIADGGSTDNTWVLLQQYKKKSKIKHVMILMKNGNRSIGRNEAIKHATGDIILCSDAGCFLDKNWIKNITQQFKDVSVDVVAGYYQGYAITTFQKCLIPYVLVMPDKVDPADFLPATRSMAFTKIIWRKAGKFPEAYSHNEDYVFAKKLKEIGADIIFQKDAFVYWIPRNNLQDAGYMFYRFATGDAEAGIYRSKVLLIFLRYILVLGSLFYALLYDRDMIRYMIYGLGIVYICWSIIKNYRYASTVHAVYLLPILQITSDIAVMAGTLFGTLKKHLS